MPKTNAKKLPKSRDVHFRLSNDEYTSLKQTADDEARSVTSQVLVYVRRGIAQDAKQ